MDTDFMMPETRRRIQQIFQEVPEDERDSWLEFFEVFQAHTRQEFLRNRLNYYNGLYTVNWSNMAGLLPFQIPLVIIRFDVIWRRLNIRRQLLRIYRFLLTTISLIRVLVIIYIFFHHIRKMVFVYTNIVTFLDNFVVDIITFVLKNNRALLDIRKLMESDKCNDWIECADYIRLYNIEKNDYNKMSFLGRFNYDFYLYISSWVALIIRVTCEGDNPQTCQLQQSLPFYFASAFERYFGTEQRLVDLIAVGFYMVYACLGLILCFGVAFMMTLHFQLKVETYAEFIKLTVQAIWRG